MVRVFIADEHPVIRYSIQQALPSITVVGEASTPEELLTRLPNCRCDVLIVDLALSHPNGLSLILTLRARYPHVRILVFSESTNLEYIDDAFSHGVAGYVVKSATFNELHVAVQRLFVGQTYRSLPFDEGQLGR